MLTRTEGERLAQAIHSMRPEWPVSSLLTTIGKRKDRPLLDLALELMYVAIDPDTKSPARIDVDGPWKRLNLTSASVTQYREITGADCAICSRPAHMHSALSKVDPHEWEPQNVRGRGAKPTPEQRAAMDKAAAEARDTATAAREKAEAEMEVAPVDEVLKRHARDERETA